MRNEIYTEMDTVSLPVPSGLKSGDPVKVGGLVGVLATDRGDATHASTFPIARAGGNPDGWASVVVDPERAFLLTVTGAITAAGTPVYIDGSNKLTVTATGNTLFGFTLPGPDGKYLTKAAGDGPAVVKLTAV